MKKFISIIFLAALIAGCKKTDEFLTRLPLDQMTDEGYWKTEENVKTFAWFFYTNAFPGYAAGFDLSWGGYFAGETLNDDFAPTTPATFVKTIPPTDAKWTFAYIRRANLMIDRVQKVPMSDEAIRNWTGVARFFRGLEYANKVKLYGDFPWFSGVLEESDTSALFKPRDPRTLVMDSVLEDLKYAAANVRDKDDATGPQQLIVNKWTVLAFMTRVFLFEASWQKYHLNNTAKANEYFDIVKWAATECMKGPYNIAPDYRKMFNSVDLTGNPEIIMFRRYETGAGLVTHSLNTYNNKEPQTGASKNALEAYLSNDGLPIGVSPKYKGDKTVTDVMTDRDPRMYATFVRNVLRLPGVVPNFSTTGYAVHKFLNEDIMNSNEGLGQNNITDAPVIRLGEVLLNYVEAAAELGNITQADIDKTINRLRKRTGIGMPDLQISPAGGPAVNGQAYDDPKRDPAIPSLLWEIRRERRIELMMEGFRNSDLRRWKLLAYSDTKANADINRGAWIKKSDYPASLSVTIENNAAEGYIIPATKAEAQRIFNDPKVYLNPLPVDQIKIYADRGVELKQNTGW